MTLQEAMKSGKRFKRPQFTYYLHIPWSEVIYTEDNTVFNASVGDILATDWELEEKPLMVTRSSFKEAWDHAIEDDTATRSNLFELICTRLGL